MDRPALGLVHVQKFAVCESRQRGGTASYSRTKTLKNQLVVHTLCLALVLEGCRLEFEVLSQDLKLSDAEARAMIRELVRFRWVFWGSFLPQAFYFHGRKRIGSFDTDLCCRGRKAGLAAREDIPWVALRADEKANGRMGIRMDSVCSAVAPSLIVRALTQSR